MARYSVDSFRRTAGDQPIVLGDPDGPNITVRPGLITLDLGGGGRSIEHKWTVLVFHTIEIKGAFLYLIMAMGTPDAALRSLELRCHHSPGAVAGYATLIRSRPCGQDNVEFVHVPADLILQLYRRLGTIASI